MGLIRRLYDILVGLVFFSLESSAIIDIFVNTISPLQEWSLKTKDTEYACEDKANGHISCPTTGIHQMKNENVKPNKSRRRYPPKNTRLERNKRRIHYL